MHDNENVGMWADADNSGLDISGNYISNNYGEGVIYEISYNGLIADNTFVHNAVGEGPTNPGFPTGAIYISESGSSSAVPGPYKNDLLDHRERLHRQLVRGGPVGERQPVLRTRQPRQRRQPLHPRRPFGCEGLDMRQARPRRGPSVHRLPLAHRERERH